MLDFYRRVWVEKKPKALVLWEAKTKQREARDERGEPREPGADRRPLAPSADRRYPRTLTRACSGSSSS